MQVNGGSKAEKAHLQAGDVILEINGENTSDMLNVEAQNKIKNSKTQLELLVERYDTKQLGMQGFGKELIRISKQESSILAMVCNSIRDKRKLVV